LEPRQRWRGLEQEEYRPQNLPRVAWEGSHVPRYHKVSERKMTSAGSAQQLSTPSERFRGRGSALRTGLLLRRKEMPSWPLGWHQIRNAVPVSSDSLPGTRAASGPHPPSRFHNPMPNAGTSISLYAMYTIIMHPWLDQWLHLRLRAGIMVRGVARTSFSLTRRWSRRRSWCWPGPAHSRR